MPLAFRTDIIKLISSFRTLEKGEELFNTLEENPDIFILYSGRLKFSKYPLEEIEKEKAEIASSDFFSNKENFKEIQPIYTFGSIDALTLKPTDKWVNKFYVYALEDCQLMCMKYSDVKAKILKLNQQLEYSEDSEFLKRNIPGLSNIIASNRNKIIQSFKKKEYPLPKMFIIKEGNLSHILAIKSLKTLRIICYRRR